MALYVYSNLIMTRVLGDFDTGKDMKAVGQGVYFFCLNASQERRLMNGTSEVAFESCLANGD